MSSGTTSELPIPVEQESDEPEVIHILCADAPRNNPVPTVGCCGYPFIAEESSWYEDAGPEKDCPLCVLAFEMGACACFYWS